LCDRSHRAAAGDAARNVLAFGQGENPLRTTTDSRGDSTMTFQQQPNDYMVFANLTTNGM
jgi:hypothetical protein